MEKHIFAVGDKVKINDFYLGNYPDWKVKDAVAEVVAVKFTGNIPDGKLEKADKPVYHNEYGRQKEYPLYDIMIKLDENLFRVSQLGITLA